MDLDKSFQQQCYKLLRQIPRGKVVTYADIAHQLGGKAYQAVGSAMAKNPDLITLPCHRVVKSNGFVGHYVLGTEEKIKLLETEGVTILQGKIVNFHQQRYHFYSTE